MFDAIQVATENAVAVSADTSLPYEAPVKYSEALLAIAASNAIDGIVHAFARCLVLRGVPKEEITEKINDLLVSAKTAGDLSSYRLEWLKSSNWYEEMSRSYRYQYECPSDYGMWTFISDVWSAADMESRGWWYENLDADELRGLKPDEVSIMQKYDEVRREYERLDRMRSEMFGKLSRTIITNILRKYGEQLSKLDEPLYKALCDSFSVKIEDPEVKVSVVNGTDVVTERGNDPIPESEALVDA